MYETHVNVTAIISLFNIWVKANILNDYSLKLNCIYYDFSLLVVGVFLFLFFGGLLY